MNEHFEVPVTVHLHTIDWQDFFAEVPAGAPRQLDFTILGRGREGTPTEWRVGGRSTHLPHPHHLKLHHAARPDSIRHYTGGERPADTGTLTVAGDDVTLTGEGAWGTFKYVGKRHGHAQAMLSLDLDATTPTLHALLPHHYGVGAMGACPGISCASCGSNLVPSTLTLTFGGALSGVGAVTVSYSGTNGTGDATWAGSKSTSCGSVSVTVTCLGNGGGWTLAGTIDGTNALSATQNSYSCSPLNVGFASTNFIGSCSGAYTASLTA